MKILYFTLHIKVVKHDFMVQLQISVRLFFFFFFFLKYI
ncbi:hypothetical protein PFBG_05447 [Plasmodium falciparum 7G8]|uniref:Uncharacterized protein n=1 Tax=Plasmodium falciparum (isolate 7G8) TaxID=57266 RepID=W7F123_PLAF8|nr:hypothetical protein PFBG_05447 [Plasmodium falciparum 7G8]